MELGRWGDSGRKSRKRRERSDWSILAEQARKRTRAELGMEVPDVRDLMDLLVDPDVRLLDQQPAFMLLDPEMQMRATRTKRALQTREGGGKTGGERRLATSWMKRPSGNIPDVTDIAKWMREVALQRAMMAGGEDLSRTTTDVILPGKNLLRPGHPGFTQRVADEYGR